MTVSQLLLINFGAFLTALGGVFLKRVSLTLKNYPEISLKSVFSLLTNGNVWGGGVCYVIPLVLWAYLLKSIELSKLQPLLALVYVYTLGTAYFLLGELPSVQRLIGIAVVIVGVVIVGRS